MGVTKGYKYTRTLVRAKRKTATFSQVKKFCTKQKIRSLDEYRTLHKQGKIPQNMPITIWRFPQWIGSQHFFNGGKKRVKFWSFEKARTYVRKLKISTQVEFHSLMKQKILPPEIPSNPDVVYA